VPDVCRPSVVEFEYSMHGPMHRLSAPPPGDDNRYAHGGLIVILPSTIAESCEYIINAFRTREKVCILVSRSGRREWLSGYYHLSGEGDARLRINALALYVSIECGADKHRGNWSVIEFRFQSPCSKSRI
jgi:hypothetical protein